MSWLEKLHRETDDTKVVFDLIRKPMALWSDLIEAKVTRILLNKGKQKEGFVLNIDEESNKLKDKEKGNDSPKIYQGI